MKNVGAPCLVCVPARNKRKAQRGKQVRGCQILSPDLLHADPSLHILGCKQARCRLRASPVSPAQPPRAVASLQMPHQIGNANTHARTHTHTRASPPQTHTTIRLLESPEPAERWAPPGSTEAPRSTSNRPKSLSGEKKATKANSMAAGSILAKPHNLGLTVSLLLEKAINSNEIPPNCKLTGISSLPLRREFCFILE